MKKHKHLFQVNSYDTGATSWTSVVVFIVDHVFHNRHRACHQNMVLDFAGLLTIYLLALYFDLVDSYESIYLVRQKMIFV